MNRTLFAQGLAALLAGTGLEAARGADGSFTLRRSAATAPTAAGGAAAAAAAAPLVGSAGDMARLRALAPGHLAQLGAAVTFGASYLVAKRLSEQVPASVVVAMMSLTVCIGLAPLAALNWVPPSGVQCAVLACTAIFATAGHYAMTRAFAAAPLTVTQPVALLQLLWAALLGALAFGEPVDIWVLTGGAVMIGAISYITWREARLRRDAITPPSGATREG